VIHADFETYSEANLKEVGTFKYAEHPSTRILVLCWSFDDGPVHWWGDGKCSSEAALIELFERVRKGEQFGAWNTQFEYCIWNFVMRRHFKKVPRLRAKQLNCTAARAAMCGLPRALGKSADALGVDVRKDKRGDALIKLFCKPRKPTKKDARTRVLPSEAPEQFREFIEYCRTDVSTERDVDEQLPQLSAFERRAFLLDYTINTRGIPIDVEVVAHAGRVIAELERRVKERARVLTVENEHNDKQGIRPTQRDRLLEWLERQGFELENLQAKTITKLLEGKDIDPVVRTLLLLRIEASKASVKKLVKMHSVPGKGGRARGTILYYGAHTGRDAGKLIQPQNFIRGLPKKKDQALLMQLVFSLLEHRQDADVFEMVFENPITAIAMCMRGFIKARKGKKLLVVDYAQIEARLLVWLAGQQDAVDEYKEYDRVVKMAKADAEEYRRRTGRGFDRYVLMGAFLFGISPLEVSDEQRRIAKNLVLGCGFQLGWRKFIEYCAKQDLIIDEEMSKRAVGAFREKHEAVVQYWYDVERCAIAAVKRRGTRVHLRNVSFYYGTNSKFLTIRLPSGRDLFYPFPEVRIVPDPWKKGKTKEQLTYMTMWKSAMWLRTSTYGGSLVENIDQGLARDIMVLGTENAEAHDYPVVLKVHDEMLAEVDNNSSKTAHALEQLVTARHEWMGDCPIAAEGGETIRYCKI
jgi:DNA polymerase